MIVDFKVQDPPVTRILNEVKILNEELKALIFF